mgnify:FL=1
MASYTTTPGNYVKFLRGTPTAWAKIPDSDKDKDTLYFISETNGATGQLYLGPKLIIGEISNINNIGDLQDVLISEDITANNILIYDDAQQKWINKPIFEVLSQIITIMVGAKDDSNGLSGLVPPPKAGDNKLYLRGDAKWANPTAAVELVLDTLVGQDTGKSIREISKEEVLKVVDGASEKFDTLKEIEEWIENNHDATDIINLDNRVTKLETTVGDSTKGLVKDVADLKTSSEKVNTTLFGDEAGTNQGLVKTVSSLQTEMVEVSNKVNILDGRLKWQDINEIE